MPPPPPSPGWTQYRDGLHHWWHYTGPLGEYWKDNTPAIIPYEDGESKHLFSEDIHSEPHDGHSAISLVLAIKKKLKASPKLERFALNADRLLEMYSRFATPCPTVSVMESAVDLWSCVLVDTNSADVRLECGAEEVRAHSLVLSKASPVLGAALQAPMLEGSSRVLQVPGVSSAAVQLVLDLAYTGQLSGASGGARTELEALDVAHRWQMQPVVRLLETLLAEQLREKAGSSSLEASLVSEILEAALLKDLKELVSACEWLVSESEDLRSHLSTGAFGPRASRHLQRHLGSGRTASEAGSCEERPKRRRFQH